MRFTGITQANAWQIATGDGSRTYDRVFFELGIGCVGPGDSGAWNSPRCTQWFVANEEGLQRVRDMSRIKVGEWLIARKGLYTIVGVGRVVTGIGWSDVLEDVQGWDLQHFVTVEWYKPRTPGETIILNDTQFGWYTLSACTSPEVYQLIADTEFDPVPATRPIATLPPATEITASDMSAAFMDAGLRAQDADNVASTIERLSRLTRWYQKNDQAVLEDEIRAFIVCPLLIALGWSEQRIKLEYGATDVSLFNKPFIGGSNAEPHVIVEVKTFRDGLAFTGDQLARYAQQYPGCKYRVATNGYRYVYEEWDNGAIVKQGSFNLLKLRKENTLDAHWMSPIDTILALSRFQ